MNINVYGQTKVYATNYGATSTTVLLAVGSVTNPGNAIGANLSANFAELNIGSLAGSASANLQLKFINGTQNLPAGTSIYVRLDNTTNTGLLGLLLASNGFVAAYKDAASGNSLTDSSSGTLVTLANTDVQVLTISGASYVKITPTACFNSIRLSINTAGLLGLLSGANLKVYHAYYECPTITIPTPAAICANTGTTLSVTNPATCGTYNWYDASTGGNLLGSGSNFNTGNLASTKTFYAAYSGIDSTCGRVAVTVTVNPLPIAFIVSGFGSYCQGGTGLPINLSGSETGVNYQLQLGGVNTGSPIAGTGSALVFPLQTAIGTYTVVATNTTTNCVATMSGSTPISINPLPTLFTVSGTGSFCQGGTGLAINLSGSQTGVNYQLQLGGVNTGSPMAGTGSAFAFPLQTIAGVYTVIATNSSTTCTATMSSSATISINPSPTLFTVSGGGSFCQGGTGLAINLSGSQTGINYQLKLGGVNTGSPMAGTGSALVFPLQTAAGTYTVVATNATTNCVATMSGNATISINPLPTLFTVSGGGSFCQGGTGLAINLSGSQTGINYQLKLGGVNTGSPMAGTGSALVFPLQTAAGTYTVIATNSSTTCTVTMSSSATISINPSPTLFTVSGGGSFCQGGTGLAINLSGSQTGVNYQLQLGGVNTGSALAGTGSALVFPLQTAAGMYTVVATNATTSCVATMSGNATISINPLPTLFTVSGSGSFCQGGTGLAINLSGSQTGINYQLQLGGVNTGSALAGTGSALVFPLQTAAGAYTVVATNATTNCVATMSGNATISINPLPTLFTVSGSGSFCQGGTGLAINLSGSQTGVNYQLQLGGVNTGSALAGTGSALVFPLQTAAGTYTVVATNATTSCVTTMSGNATISINPLPTLFTVSGSGSFCQGGTGLAINLSGSQTGVNYQLQLGGVNIGSALSGTGSALVFPLQTAAGAYTVVATNATTSCVATMSGSATISINPLPTLFTVSGSGSFCQGGTGLAINLSGSQTGINYQLQLGGVNTGSALAGTGSALVFPLQTAAGTYTVVATNSVTSCVATMSGSATISINILPTITLGTNPRVCKGVTIATLPYSSTTGNPITYSIEWNNAAISAGFVNINNNTLSATIDLVIPTGVPAGTYNGVVRVKNSTCESISYAFVLTLYPSPSYPDLSIDSATD
ncbi:beta strand repeat-containing protein [Flavobacterium sp. '19STA2R22 D10 B1']|uniref:beta strand repeat-containing protein n=1 Tax=Flavobacterium aerium TaxID=3037261 RepID=UPI00278BC6F9|nr:hypothetical protein [Flavobacterium sp. '19STA2R22 D10 B1']